MQILKSPALLLGFSSRPRNLVCRASGQQNHNERNNYNVRKGKQFENSRRRRGRPAHLRSPYDSPLRDGNRDRLIGLLTERAAKTLMIYLMETNANVYSWLVEFYKKNPIPRDGSWDEISGEAFLRKLLSMPIEEAKFNTGRDSLFDNASSCGVDPRSIAQRIMDIRTQLSEEFVQELQAIAEENSLLLRETLQTSLSTTLTAVDDTAKTASKDGTPVHPELADSSSSSSSSSSTSKDSSSSGGSSSGKGGAVSTPPPSPIPGTPKGKPEPIKGAASSSSSSNSSSQKSSSDAADKAAAVAKLNASLQKPTRPGAGSSSNGGNSSSSSSSTDEKVDMVDILAQLRRAMEADVARDVLKMKESTVSSSSSSSKDSPASISTPEAADAAAAAAAEGLSPATSPEQQVATAAPVTDEAAPTPVVADSAAAAVQETNGASAAAAAATAQASIDEDVSITISTQLSNSAVGEAGTYSRMLPKGWGPRLGVGFSRYPRSRNNIVSSANLGALKPGAAGDALSGSAAGEAV